MAELFSKYDGSSNGLKHTENTQYCMPYVKPTFYLFAHNFCQNIFPSLQHVNPPPLREE